MAAFYTLEKSYLKCALIPIPKYFLLSNLSYSWGLVATEHTQFSRNSFGYGSYQAL